MSPDDPDPTWSDDDPDLSYSARTCRRCGSGMRTEQGVGSRRWRCPHCGRAAR